MPKKRNTLSIEAIKKWANSNPVLVVMFVIIVSISSLVTITEGLTKINSYYLSSFWKLHKAYEQVYKLNIDTQINNFEDILGRAFFVNQHKKYKEYLFLEDLFYVQAIADLDDKVIMYAVTTRSNKFKPRFETAFFDKKEKGIDIILGKTRFYEIANYPHDIYGFCSANMLSFYYVEMFYLGGSGRFLDYAVAYNGAGSGEVGELYFPLFNETIDRKELIKQIQEKGFSEELQKFRNNIVVNTYCIMEPGFDFELDQGKDESLTVGPDISQLILLRNWKFPAEDSRDATLRAIEKR
jgi:hypothetical protein